MIKAWVAPVRRIVCWMVNPRGHAYLLKDHGILNTSMSRKSKPFGRGRVFFRVVHAGSFLRRTAYPVPFRVCLSILTSSAIWSPKLKIPYQPHPPPIPSKIFCKFSKMYSHPRVIPVCDSPRQIERPLNCENRPCTGGLIS